MNEFQTLSNLVATVSKQKKKPEVNLKYGQIGHILSSKL